MRSFYSFTKLLIFMMVLLPSSFVFAGNPGTPISPSDNIQDPGDPGTAWGGCGPTDSNCYVTVSVIDTNFATTNLTQTAARTYAGAGYNYTFNNLGKWEFNMAASKSFIVQNGSSYDELYLSYPSPGWQQFLTKGSYFTQIDAQTGTTAALVSLAAGNGSNYSSMDVQYNAINIDADSGNLKIGNLTNLSTQNRLLGQYGTDGKVGYTTVSNGLNLASGALKIGGTITANTDIGLGSDNFSFGDYTTTGNNYTTFNSTSTENYYSNGTDLGYSSVYAGYAFFDIRNSTHRADLQVNPNQINLQSSNLGFTVLSRIRVNNDEIFITPYSGKLTVNNLTNLSTQNRLLGQYGTSDQVGYITIGTGLSLSSGVLSSSLGTAVESGELATQGTATDEYCLTSETSGGALLEWQSCGAGGSGTVNTGTSGYFSYYPSTGTTVDDQTVMFTNGTNIGIGDTSPNALLTVGNGDLFQVDSSGKVGIGTGPSAALLTLDKIGGGSGLSIGQGQSAGDYGQLSFTGNAGNNETLGWFTFNNTATNGGLGASIDVLHEGTGAVDNKTYFAFSTDNGVSLDERLRIASSGRIGIGDQSPDYLLDAEDTSTDGNIFSLHDSDGECLYNPEAGSVTVSCSSDERLKRNIVDSGSVLDYLNTFRIRDYDVIASGDHMTGVIAQEVLANHPELVTQGADGMYSVQLPNQWKVIKAIQELNIKVTGALSLEDTSEQSLGSRLKLWFASASNNIQDFIANRIKARQEVCVGDTCINEDQLKSLIQNAGVNTQPAQAVVPTLPPEPIENTPTPEVNETNSNIENSEQNITNNTTTENTQASELTPINNE